MIRNLVDFGIVIFVMALAVIAILSASAKPLQSRGYKDIGQLWCQEKGYQGQVRTTRNELVCYKVSGDMRVEQTFKLKEGP